MGVLELGRDLDLAQEPVGPEGGGELRVQDLDRDLAAVLQVLGQEDRGHAAAADLRLDGVAVGKGRLQALKEIHHVRAPGRSGGVKAI